MFVVPSHLRLLMTLAVFLLTSCNGAKHEEPVTCPTVSGQEWGNVCCCGSEGFTRPLLCPDGALICPDGHQLYHDADCRRVCGPCSSSCDVREDVVGADSTLDEGETEGADSALTDVDSGIDSSEPDGITVQLVWRTPADPDETNTCPGCGSNLDLHLLRDDSGARWNEPPHDCCWHNDRPNWGNPDSSKDDPALDFDDTDGAGPEHIHLDFPSDGDFQIGVHYRDDHGWGPSYATVRVWVEGDGFEFIDKPLNAGEFWLVGSISWSEGNTVSLHQVDRVYEGFP